MDRYLRRNVYYSEGDPTLIIFLVGIFVILPIVLFIGLYPVKSRHTFIVETHWTTSTHLIEEYEDCDWEYDTDTEGNTTSSYECDYEERTLASAYLRGTVNDPIVFPPYFPENDVDKYNKHSLGFHITYQEEETQEQFKEMISRDQFYSSQYQVGRYCLVKTSLIKKVISQECR